MNRIKDGSIDAKEAYMKAANKAAFTSLLRAGRPRTRPRATRPVARGGAKRGRPAVDNGCPRLSTDFI